MDADTLARVVAAGYLDGLHSRAMADLRAMRAECQGLEDQVSYTRRIVQGRLDIVRHEHDRRARGEPPSDLSALIEDLALSLGDSEPGRASTRHVALGSIPDLFPGVQAVLDAAAIDELPNQDDTALAQLLERLQVTESDLSAARRHLFDRLDALSDELTRRYRSGEADVDELLG